VTLVELLAPVAVAVTVAVSDSATLDVQASKDVPPAGIAIVVTLSEQDEPPVEVTARVTLFEKPPRDATVTVEVPPGERAVVTLVGLALMLMPGGGPTVLIVTDTVVEFFMILLVPPVPVITTE